MARARALAVGKLATLTDLAETDPGAATRRATRALGREGFLALLTVKAYGGKASGIDHRALVAAREGIAYGSAVAHSAFAVQGLGMVPLTIAGSNDQKREWLPKAARGTVIGGYGLTEPTAGSDVAAMATRATRQRGGWSLTGTKTYISNAGVADFYCIFGKTDPSAGHRGISCFLVPADARGLRTKPLRMLASVPIGTVELKGVKVGDGDVIGDVGSGFYTAMRTLDTLRPTVASAACGVAARALDEAVRRARSRRAFGKTLAEQQGIRWRLAQAATDLEAARLLTYRAAWLKDQGQERITMEAAQAKLFATEAAWRIVDMAVQVHGASGLERDSETARMYREIRALRVYEGTSEILQEVVGAKLVQ